MSPQLHETLIGRKFLDHTMPEIARQLERVADVLEKINQGEIKITLALPTNEDVSDFIEEDTKLKEEPKEDQEQQLEERLEKMDTPEEKFDFVRDLLIQRFEILEEKVSILIEFLEYEEAYTKDRLSQKRIRGVLEKIGAWKSK